MLFRALGPLAASLALSGCFVVSVPDPMAIVADPYAIAPPTPGYGHARAACPTPAAGALVGAVQGGFSGGVIGSFWGDAGRGAAIGAGLGAVVGAAAATGCPPPY